MSTLLESAEKHIYFICYYILKSCTNPALGVFQLKYRLANVAVEYVGN